MHFENIYRYDVLFVFALVIQIILIITKAEKPKEVLAIIIFHICAMGMEIFKTSPMVGSWAYPEPAILAISTVPLLLDLCIHLLGLILHVLGELIILYLLIYLKIILFFLGLAIYVNFFTNHFIYDFRYVIFLIAVIIFENKVYVNLTSKDFKYTH